MLCCDRLADSPLVGSELLFLQYQIIADRNSIWRC
jgi:hypothetical protein